jgi:hypothetical protein
MDATFAELVDRVAREAGLNDYQLAAAIGLLPGRRVFSSKQVARLRRGEQRHLEPELVHRLIEILDLDPPTAWEKAGLWPPGLTAEQLRMVTRPAVPALAAASATSRRRRSDRPVAAQGKRTTDQLSHWAGQRPALTIITGQKAA